MSQTTEPSARFSGRLFYRVYFAVVICIVVIGSLLDYLAAQSSASERLIEFQAQVQPLFALISERLVQTPAEERDQVTDQLSQQMGRTAYLLNASDFSGDPEFHAALSSGTLIPLFGHNDDLTFYQLLPGQQQILAIDVPGYNNTSVGRVWLVTAFYALVALAIFILLRPFTRDLMKLKTAAASLGQDDFSTRISVARQSNLSPVLQTFNRMADRIETLVNSQRDLTNSVSHELRTPLARLKFAFEAIESQTPETAQAIDDMRDDVEELELLIEEMLCYAEINQIQDLSTSTVPLRSILSQAVEPERLAHIELTTTLDESCEPELLIECDSHHLIRAFRNVIRNSVRFARSRCLISVVMEADALNIDVDDDGPGIAEQHRQRIFDPFYKVDALGSSGFGLGLSIARSVMQKHHGDLLLVSSTLGGTCFRFRFPTTVIC